MISQVSDRGMISEAYKNGIDFYISKPINVIEVISITKSVIISQKNKRMIEQIGNTIIGNVSGVVSKEITDIDFVFDELGILYEKGSSDLSELIKFIRNDKLNNFKRGNISITSLYNELSKVYLEKGISRANSSKAIEARIRRTIKTALINIANLGIEDFSNEKFDRYANSLFGFSEVKKVMDSIRKDNTIKVTINIKKFINGLINVIE